jgi:glycosyltransferase involved in cell wall biosynthesis
MRILFYTQWFDPEPGAIKGPEFVRRLEAAGHEVTVVTGFPNYRLGRLYPGYKMRMLQREVVDGARVERIPLYPSHSPSSVGRAVNFLSFFLSLFVYGVLRAGRHDFIYAYHPPITVGLAASLVGFIRRRPFSIEIQDLWPDMLAASGMPGTGRLAKVLNPICNFVYARASAVIVQSNGMRDRLIDRGVPADKLSVIRNPADPTALDRPAPMSRERLGLAPTFTFLYGGNLGAAQQLSSAVRAAKRAQELGGDIHLRLMGRGIDADNLKREAAEIGATNVSFGDPVEKEEVPAVFQAGDVLLNQWADHPLFNITIPSKTQFYLACGKPILAAMGGETADILRQSGAAVVVPSGDSEAMAQAMVAMSRMTPAELDAMGRSGYDYYQRTFSWDTVIRDTVAAIDGGMRRWRAR